MNIFNRKKHKNIESRSLDSLVLSTVANPSDEVLNIFKSSDQNSLQLSTVWRCVAVISDTISILRPQLYRKLKDGYRQEIFDPQIIEQIYDRPNQIMSWSDTLKCMTVSYLLNGNAYLYVKRDHRGIPISLIPVAPDRVIVTYDEINFTISYYITGIGNVEYTDVIHIRNFVRAGQPYLGQSVLAYSDQTLALAHHAQKYVSDFFAKGADSGYLHTEKDLSATATRRTTNTDKQSTTDKLRDMWRTVRGIRVLDNGLTWKTYGISMKDYQLQESRQQSVIDIAQLFGVSPKKLYSTQTSTDKSSEQENIQFLTDTILPICQKFTTEINDKLLATNLKRQYELYFDPFTLQKSNLVDFANYVTTLTRSGLKTRNEIRREMKQPKIKGGDVITVQMQDIPLDQIDKISSKKDLKNE